MNEFDFSFCGSPPSVYEVSVVVQEVGMSECFVVCLTAGPVDLRDGNKAGGLLAYDLFDLILKQSLSKS